MFVLFFISPLSHLAHFFLSCSPGHEERQLRAVPGVGAAVADAALPHAGGGGAARRRRRLPAGD